MQDNPVFRPRDVVPFAIKTAVLLGLAAWVFRTQLSHIIRQAPQSSETAYTVVTPLGILFLIWLRRKEIASNLNQGSYRGILLILSGLFLFSAATWPFSYGFARDVSIIPIVAGIVWAVGGGKVLKLSLPMIFLLLLAIPIGSRIYAALIIRPETYTIAATAKALDALPGIATSVSGTDLVYQSGEKTGQIAAGESNRGARLLQTYLAIGIFVLFSRIRSWWRIIFVAVLSLPMVLFCNFFRLFIWGVMVIYSQVSPLSGLPRNLSAIIALLLCYLLFVFFSSFRLNLFITEEDREIRIEGEQHV